MTYLIKYVFQTALVEHEYRNKLMKTLTKYILCECKCRFDGRKCNSNQWWNNDKCQCEFKKRHDVKKIMFRIQLHVVVKMKNV